eukprot:COSAG06_NODE_18025_length_908_cov_1.060569_2_plen_60_part_01
MQEETSAVHLSLQSEIKAVESKLEDKQERGKLHPRQLFCRIWISPRLLPQLDSHSSVVDC